MRLLLSTHPYLWYVGGHTALSETCHTLVENTENSVFVSTARLWEAAIKTGLGKLDLYNAHTVQELVEVGIDANRPLLLGITPAHLDGVRTLPLHHRDPFDRLLTAQASNDDLTLPSRDPALSAYGVPVLW